MSARRHPNVINADEVPARSTAAGAKIGSEARQLGQAVGARRIGCSLYEVSPGKSAFPFHFHCANEESLYVLEGEGALRLGGETVPVRAGDYVAFPVGPDGAHQLRNIGVGPLRYLCLSTTSTAEVVGYPDSKKIGAMAAPSMEAAAKGEGWVRVLTYVDSPVGYYDGEEID